VNAQWNRNHAQAQAKETGPTRKSPESTAKLRQALSRRKKAELVEVSLEPVQADRGVLRQLTARFDVAAPTSELVTATRQAIADATDLYERDSNRNFDDVDNYSWHMILFNLPAGCQVRSAFARRPNGTGRSAAQLRNRSPCRVAPLPPSSIAPTPSIGNAQPLAFDPHRLLRPPDLSGNVVVRQHAQVLQLLGAPPTAVECGLKVLAKAELLGPFATSVPFGVSPFLRFDRFGAGLARGQHQLVDPGVVRPRYVQELLSALDHVLRYAPPVADRGRRFGPDGACEFVIEEHGRVSLAALGKAAGPPGRSWLHSLGYYSAQIILFGAVFMRVLSVECGERVVPAENTARQPAVAARKNRGRPSLREVEHVEVGVDVLTAKQPDSS
jgi:hypothetical protein